MSGTNRSYEGASSRETRVKARPVLGLTPIRIQAKSAVTRNTMITARKKYSSTHHAEFGVFCALPSSVGGRKIGFVVTVRSGDNVGWLDGPTGFGTLVSTRRIRVGSIVGGIVVAAVFGVESIEEVVERGALHVVSNLVESDGLLGAYEGHTILEIEIGFTAEVETRLVGLKEA